MTSLGKRKDRDETKVEESHGSTLFVSNLPYTATSVDLETLFSDFAPVRSAFVVQEHGTGVSKGVGYVSFAIREDAQTAYDQVAKEGILLDGRNLRVVWADKKKEKGTAAPTKTEADEVRKLRPKTLTATPRDPLAIRTIVVSGLPSGIDSKTLWKKVRKFQGASQVDWPSKASDGTEEPGSAQVLFDTPAHAQEAVTKLHAHVYKGSLLSVSLKKRLDTVAKAPRAAKTTKVTGPAPSRGSRLIVRNLPFDITEQDLRALFLPYGPVYSITIPQVVVEKKDEDGDVKMEEGAAPQTRGKGFAFVWMWSKKEAEKAMEGCNGKKVKAGFAAGMVEDKQKKKKERREAKKKAAQAGEAEKVEGEEGEEEPVGTETDKGERIIAVDWALSKEKWEEEKKKADQEEADASGSDSEDSSGSDEGESDGEEALGVHGDHSDGSEDESGSEVDDDRSDGDEEPVKPQLPPPEKGTTLFVRNIPFEATNDELRLLFRTFGPLRYARITMDHETGRSRGTGFVCFWNIADADKAVEQSEILRMETAGKNDAPKKNPFSMPSILTPDPSARSAQSLVLQGRTLDVVRAVTRDEAGKLKEAGEKAREKADKRNMYLLREGVILANTPAAATLPPIELEKRTNSFNARRTLLRSNPSLFISKTRLSIRQIPLFVSERMLKRLAIHSIRAFDSEVRDRTRQPLSEDELAVVSEHKDEEGAEAKPKKGKYKPGRNTGVKQSKIIRQQDRVDSITGKGRSRGYGFLELHTHQDALRVLRWANNNPAVFPLLDEWRKDELKDLIKEVQKTKGDDSQAKVKRMTDELESIGSKPKGALIVEFSIENIQVVQRRATLQKDSKAAPGEKKPREKLALPKAEDEDTPAPKKRRVSGEGKSKSSPEKPTPEKGGNPVGSLIGRKRKERKAKKGGR
ncbi:hypothetical protein DENSPDRAFT_801527 [Dentipellis sp. KUC8613]|nr:hypothetical protein DENSPDRAFT_801527 [Dentipellis sp. KUC8613]